MRGWKTRRAGLRRQGEAVRCDDVSPTVLQARLTELRQAGLIDLERARGYELTGLGRELFDRVLPLHDFAERWASR